MSRYSYGVVIPKDFVKKLRWREKQKLVVKLGGKSLSIFDWPVSPKARRGGKKKKK